VSESEGDLEKKNKDEAEPCGESNAQVFQVEIMISFG